MRKRKKITGATALFFMLILLYAASMGTASAAEVVDKVQTRYNGLTTISAKFSQLSVNKVSMMREESRGTVYFSKPGKMRWEYEEPERRLIVSDGETVWTYLPEQNQVYVAKLSEEYISRTPLSFLIGKGNLQEEFDVNSTLVNDEQKGSLFRIDLQPKRPQLNLSKLILEVDSESYLIIKSDMYDSMGNLISISFEQIVTDPDLPPNLFQFSPPDNVEIVEVWKYN